MLNSLIMLVAITLTYSTPQGAHHSLTGLPSGPPTTAMATKSRTPSLTALKKAVRSAQLLGV